MTADLPRWAFRLVLLLAACVAAASLTWPFGWDQGIFAWVGDVIVRGGLPYRDAWDIKGPLVYYVYALAQWLFGMHMWAIRIVDLVLLLGGCMLLLRWLRAWLDARIASWATLLFGLWYAAGSYWHTAQPDGWVMLMLIAVCVLLLHPQREPGPRAWLVCGVLIGGMTLVKFPYAAFLVLPAAIALGHDRRAGRLLLRALLCSTGFMFPLLLAAGWFYAHDALDSVIEVMLRYPADTYSVLVQQEPGSRLRGVVKYLTKDAGVSVALPFVLTGLVVAWQRSSALGLGLLAWLLCATGLVMLQNRFFSYHWLPLLPALVICAGFGVQALLFDLCQPQVLSASALRLRRVLTGSLLCVFILHVATLPAYEVLHWGAWLAGIRSDDEYYRHFGAPGGDLRMAEALRSATTAQDRVAVFGWNSAVLFLSERQSPSRFGFSMPLLQGSAEHPWFVRYRAEYMADLRAQQPAAVVVGTQADRLLGGTKSVDDFPELAGFLRDAYRAGYTTGELTLYVRREWKQP